MVSRETALTRLIEQALDSHKAEDIVTIDLTGKAAFADTMIIASGRSQKHVSTLADHVVDALKKEGFDVLSVEGQALGDWVLVDAGDVVVHLFHPEVRQMYNLEKMWSAVLTPPAELAI